MSEPAATLSSTESHSPAGAAGASPDFDKVEIRSFGHDDGHAVSVIGKMLVGFFFYSLLVMALVAAWTMGGFGQSHSESADGHHEAGDTAEF